MISLTRLIRLMKAKFRLANERHLVAASTAVASAATTAALG